MVQVLEQIQVTNSYEEERGKPMPSLNHSKLQRNLLFALTPYAEQFELLPEIAIKIGDWGVTPDIAFYPLQSTNFKHDTIKMDTPPIGAIEILSPTQSLSELVEKSEGYFLKGVKSYWLVIPEFQNIYVYEQPFVYSIFRKYEVLKDANLGIELDLKNVFK
jgi:Uma2 family endonuclease